MTIITTVLPAEVWNWRPTVFPGTPNVGCICPPYQPWPGQLVFDTDCPVHTVDVQNAWMKFVCLCGP